MRDTLILTTGSFTVLEALEKARDTGQCRFASITSSSDISPPSTFARHVRAVETREYEVRCRDLITTLTFLHANLCSANHPHIFTTIATNHLELPYDSGNPELKVRYHLKVHLSVGRWHLWNGLMFPFAPTLGMAFKHPQEFFPSSEFESPLAAYDYSVGYYNLERDLTGFFEPKPRS